MVEYDEYVDVDSNEVSSTDSHTSDDEDSSYSVSSGHDRSDDGDDTGDHDDDDDDDGDDDGNDHDFDDEASVGERAVRINSMTADEIRAMDFGSVEEAYEFYYQYGKCKGFSVRKSDDKKKIGPDGSKIITNKLFVYNRQGLRDKRHISRLDRKREHRRLTRTKCTARFLVTYKADKGRFVVSVFEETRNHELTSTRRVDMVVLGLRRKIFTIILIKKMRDIVKDGDVTASLHYLNAKSATDPMLYAEYAAAGSNGRMKSLFWADGTSDNVKNSGFLKGFKKVMLSNFSNDDFEEYWSEMIKENGVEGHPWVIKTYENKLLWAIAYLRDKFFGRIRTTSQCEAINAIIKSYVRKKGCIFEFMQNFEQALRGYRNNELVEDFKVKFSEPVLTTQLRLIESSAAKIYTAEIFKEVKEEIMKAGELIVKHKKEIEDTKFYTLTKYYRDEYERTVVYDGDTFQCSCRLFDSRGLPCSHIFM
ncbi:unnamed protein product [Trifolium pratense]|uniref:Uncharacterized protein n=1 Tax=Trifolium pratense TaxID=57577 RepID=A0ACB0KKT4_TRIPR|nr:unnamed protein product [Trifolium pratense]